MRWGMQGIQLQQGKGDYMPTKTLCNATNKQGKRCGAAATETGFCSSTPNPDVPLKWGEKEDVEIATLSLRHFRRCRRSTVLKTCERPSN